MTLWHDQTSRTAGDPSGEDRAAVSDQPRPGSRRAAREAERRAAEALAEGQQHPSGVVDFGHNDFVTPITGEHDLSANSSADIWAALTRHAEAPKPAAAERRSARREKEAAEAVAQPPMAPMTGELMDRVRDAVLGREREAAEPERPLTRRELRAQQADERTDDGFPSAWFSETGPAATPASKVPPAFGGAPEAPAFGGWPETPTVRMAAVDRADLEARAPVTAAVDLPQFFAEPIGDDELAFSNPVEVAIPTPVEAHPELESSPSFLAPRSAPTPLAATSRAASEPEPDTGRTDLAGFEALISRSRGTLAPETGLVQQQPAAASDDQHAGFAGLLTRNVATPHGSQNALIMPSDPQPDLTRAVTGDGALFVTGSLNLSRSLATTGATAGHESAEVDRMFDSPQDEHQTGVTPVRASRAVSGTSVARPVRTRRSRSNTLPLVLAIVAGVMAVGVITLLIGSWVLRLF